MHSIYMEMQKGSHTSNPLNQYFGTIERKNLVAGHANIREVKHDVYGKRQTAKMKLLPSVFSSLYSRIKIFVYAVNSKRRFSIFV